MTKCDFCAKYHNNRCDWILDKDAIPDCEKAIERMITVLQNIDCDKRKMLINNE